MSSVRGQTACATHAIHDRGIIYQVQDFPLEAFGSGVTQYKPDDVSRS